MTSLVTTLGVLDESDVGFMLPHEHLFVDFRLPEDAAQGRADIDDVVRLMVPELEAARDAGVTAMVECTPVGLGRRADAVAAVSRAAGVPVLVPTGIYREPWVPSWAHEASEGELSEWMIGELDDGIAGTGVRAAWVKVSAGDDGLTPTEEKILRAAARASVSTGAVVGSHTVSGEVLLRQIDVVEEVGMSPERFIWIHAHAEQDRRFHYLAASRGCWVEYDAIGDLDDVYFVELIVAALDAGFRDRVLLSQDRGWYDPALSGGGTPRSFTYLRRTFLPRLADARVDEETIRRLTESNPLRAFAR